MEHIRDWYDARLARERMRLYARQLHWAHALNTASIMDNIDPVGLSREDHLRVVDKRILDKLPPSIRGCEVPRLHSNDQRETVALDSSTQNVVGQGRELDTDLG
jgi:hypothetical protein